MNDRNTELDLVGCPECAAPAEVADRFVVDSTDGPAEYVKVHCINHHWFTVAAETLPSVRLTLPATDERAGRPR